MPLNDIAFTNEIRNKVIHRFIVNINRGATLLNLTIIHDKNFI